MVANPILRLFNLVRRADVCERTVLHECSLAWRTALYVLLSAIYVNGDDLYFSREAFSRSFWMLSTQHSKSLSSCISLLIGNVSKSCSMRNCRCSTCCLVSRRFNSFLRSSRKSHADFGRIITGFSNTGTVFFFTTFLTSCCSASIPSTYRVSGFGPPEAEP